MSNRKKRSMILYTIIFAVLYIDSANAETYYGSQLMTPQERAEHRAKMRGLSPSEREAHRAEHHEAMKERAKSMELSMPDQPPAYGRGYGRRGPGYGYGRGTPGYWGPGYGRRYGEPGYGRWHDSGRYWRH